MVILHRLACLLRRRSPWRHAVRFCRDVVAVLRVAARAARTAWRVRRSFGADCYTGTCRVGGTAPRMQDMRQCDDAAILTPERREANYQWAHQHGWPGVLIDDR